MTSPTNGGGEESSASTAMSDRHDRARESWEEYDRRCGVGAAAAAAPTAEAEKYLSMGADALGKLGACECGEAAFLLARLAFSLQKRANEEACSALWADENIKHLIRVSVTKKPGGSYDERRRLAVMDSKAAGELEEIRVRASCRSQRLAGLAQRADALSKTMLSLQASKRTNQNG